MSERKMVYLDDAIRVSMDAARKIPTIAIRVKDALKQLPSAQPNLRPNLQPTCNQLATDCISRQAAIEAFWKLDIETRPSWIDAVMAMLNQLPSAQPEKRTEERTETHECDLISRQAAIDTIDDLIEARLSWREPYQTEIKGLNAARCAIYDLPSVQPERKTGKWIPHNTHYTFSTGETSVGGVKCSSCGFETHNKAHRVFGCPYKFCPICGAKMEREDNGCFNQQTGGD